MKFYAVIVNGEVSISRILGYPQIYTSRAEAKGDSNPALSTISEVKVTIVKPAKKATKK
jgi:hypothetical protein